MMPRVIMSLYTAPLTAIAAFLGAVLVWTPIAIFRALCPNKFEPLSLTDFALQVVHPPYLQIAKFMSQENFLFPQDVVTVTALMTLQILQSLLPAWSGTSFFVSLQVPTHVPNKILNDPDPNPGPQFRTSFLSSRPPCHSRPDFSASKSPLELHGPCGPRCLGHTATPCSRPCRCHSSSGCL